MDLAEFLLARLADEERRAMNAAEEAGEHWRELWSGTVETTGDEIRTNDSRVSRFIVRWDPARVLAEVEAKRQIIQQHREGKFTDVNLGVHDRPVCVTCHAVMRRPDDWDEDADGDWSYPWLQREWPCPTMRALALPCADHAECHPSWLPPVRAQSGR